MARNKAGNPWFGLAVSGLCPHFYSMAENQDDGDHFFSDFDLWLGIEGSCEVRILGHSLELRAGRAILAPPGVHVQQLTGPRQELMMMYVHFHCCISGEIVRDASKYVDAERLELTLPGLPTVALTAELDTMTVTEKLRRIRTNPDDDLNHLMLSTVLLEVFIHLRAAHLGLAGSAAEHRLERVILFMERNLHRPISLVQAARQAHISPETLGRLFRSRYDLSPMQFLTRLRMARAREMLQSRRYNISEIASACGYASLEYFSRVFRKEYGVPPRVFRQRLPLIP